MRPHMLVCSCAFCIRPLQKGKQALLHQLQSQRFYQAFSYSTEKNVQAKAKPSSAFSMSPKTCSLLSWQ